MYLTAVMVVSYKSRRRGLAICVPSAYASALRCRVCLPRRRKLGVFCSLYMASSFYTFLSAHGSALLGVFATAVPPTLIKLKVGKRNPSSFLFPFFRGSVNERNGKGLSFVRLGD